MANNLKSVDPEAARTPPFSPMTTEDNSQQTFNELFAPALEHVRLIRTYLNSGPAGQIVAFLAEVQKDLAAPLRDRSWWSPPNWSLPGGGQAVTYEMFDDALAIMNDEGIPLAYVPRAKLVQELVDTDSFQDRQQLLVARECDILQDCEDVLASLDDEDLEAYTPVMRDAIAAFRAGFAGPAQSHAANCLDSLLRAVEESSPSLQSRNNKFQYWQVREGLRQMSLARRTTVGQFLMGCVLSPIVHALEKYDGKTDVPGHFSRHATAHAVTSPVQMTRANTVTAIMLTVSLMAFLQEAKRKKATDPDNESEEES